MGGEVTPAMERPHKVEIGRRHRWEGKERNEPIRTKPVAGG